MKRIIASIILALGISNQALASECTSISSNLGLGARGTQVSSLQTYLSGAGLLDSSATGYFGQLTRAAVILFQKAQEIQQTGFVGALTRAAIREASCTKTDAPQPTVKPIACSQEARLCSDGSAMARSTTSCDWLPSSCPDTSTTLSATSSLNNWNPKQATPLSDATLKALKAILQSIGYNTGNFTTTTMTEAEIMALTRKFEQDYILNK